MRNGALVVLCLVAVTGPLVGAVAGDHTDGPTVDCTFPISATDATGTTVTVDNEPERIVVLGASAAQTVWAIEADDRVVGMPVTPFTAYLDGRSDKRNVVGESSQVVTEEVVAAEPDLVLVANIYLNDTVSSVRAALPAEVAVYRFGAAGSLEAVAEKTALTGRLVGAYEAAAREAAHMRGAVATVERATRAEPEPTVYYALGGGWTAGTDTFIGHLIATAGGQNVAAAANISAYRPISQEIIAAEDPDWIVVPDGVPVPSNPAVQESTAIQEGNVLRVDSNYLNQPGPRNLVPLETMARAFHPSAMADINLNAVETPATTPCHSAVETLTPTPTTSDSGGDQTPTVTPAPTTTTATPAPTTTTTNGSGAGFGLLAGLVALLAVLGWTMRRP